MDLLCRNFIYLFIFSDNVQDSDYPSTCACWEEMTSRKLDSHSWNTLSNSTESIESGIGEVDCESDMFEAGLEEVGDMRGDSEEILGAFSDKLLISPTSSNEVIIV